jgi:hypothetical protein
MRSAALLLLLIAPLAFAQGGRGGPAQNPAVARLNDQLAGVNAAVSTARNALTAAVFAEPRSPEAIQIMVNAVRDAELARARAFASLQASGGRLPAEQASQWIANPGGPAGGRGGRGNPTYLTHRQQALLTRMNTDLAPQMQAAGAARTVLLTAAPADMASRAEGLQSAELALANARADLFARTQSSVEKLSPQQVAGLSAAGFTAGRGGAGGNPFTLPEPMDFNDHAGYVSIFDGKTLKGWDGNPKFWRVEDGSIVGESTPSNPSGNSYIVYRDVEAKDFTLKFEVKVEGTGGTGIQYRSKTGLPWLANIAPEVTANVGPVNLAWMMTGPQADFWPNSPYWTGQFYSENTPMRIMAWRGQVVEGGGLDGTKRLMGNIGDRDELAKLVRHNDWNQYVVIARGGVLLHILNGQLMAVMVDDDPASSNNQSGLIGIEIEATTKVSVRNIWLKKLN